MKNKILETLFFVMLLIVMTVTTSIGYSDDLFEFDLPSDYANISYNGIYAFSNGKGNKGMVIYTTEDSRIKKSVWDIDKSDLDDLIDQTFSRTAIIETDRKAKLGKEKAIHLVLIAAGNYMDVYILASNKYIYMVSFVGESKSDLDNEDYTMIKKSFKLKDATTDFKALYIVGVIAVIAVSAFFTYRKKFSAPKFESSDSIDYKNLTEDDFNKMN